MPVVGHKSLWLVVLALLAVASCGGEKIKVGDGKAASELKGRVLIAPVNGATVTAFKADGRLERGAALATATTNETGDFALSLPPYQGHVLLVATSGTYSEPSIGLGVQLGTTELAMLLPDFKTGSKPSGLRVTPVSTLAVEFARWHVVAKGEQLAAAYSDALVHLHQHFGGVDWAAITPADLTSDGVTNLSPEAKAGLVLAGFSWLSKTQAETSNVQTGLVLNAATLTTALAADSSDGTLDGKQVAAALSQGQVALTGLTMRNELVAAMSQFINSTRNKSALRLADISAFLAGIGTNADPYLFCPGQVATESCGSGPVDTEPPVLSFVRPSDGAGVAGSTIVEARASDNSKLGSLRFTAPSSLTGTGVVWSNGQKEGSLTASLDVSALADGPLEIRAEATDAAGNPVARSITIIVSNQGPEITISSPSGGAVQGAGISITASATARAPGATIQRIELVSPLDAGVGQDILPAADAFATIWNTTAAREGPTVITLRAVDTYGTATEASVSVVVDNVPFGVVSGVVNLGSPVDGLTVKVVAIDDSTGLPVTGRMGGPILGQAEQPTTDGGFTITLTQENYSGPVQLVAEGAGTASYVDPTDNTASVILPGTLKVSSFVSSYTTGQQIVRPITYWTTLADVAAGAYAAGRNPTAPLPTSLTASLTAIDPLFARHIVTTSSWDSRVVLPAPLTTTPQSIGDVVFAAAPDVALNQLARLIATDVGLTPVSGFSAAHLVALLQSDVADGQFDGKANGAQLSTAGATPYQLTADTTRFRQALALDTFVRSANNRTGLTRQDMQTSNIYDTISMDTSILYPASALPTPFDNQPPTVAWTITYQRDASTVAAAVGSSQLVRALSFIVADASDPSGVDSMVVSLDGVQLVGNPGSTALHFASNVDTVAWPLTDGPHVLSAHVCDRLTNCADVTSTFTVDNTKPVLTIVAPTMRLGPGAGTPKYFSQAFDVEAVASDANGVAGLSATTSGNLGVDVDPASDRLLIYAGSWSLASAAEGTATLAFASCDVVGNCASGRRDYVVDKTPPEVTIVSTLPAYTNQSQHVVRATATDAAGVAECWMQVGVAPPVLANRTAVGGAVWYEATMQFDGGDGRRDIKVWCVDAAEPGNSGSVGAPYTQVASTVFDPKPPAVQTRAPLSYRDERALSVTTDAQGKPVMPVQYVYAGGPVAVQENGRIYKLNSKMNADDPNEAFLRWAVAVEGSPVAAASFRVVAVTASDGSGTYNACTASAGVGAVTCPSGTLRVSSTTEANQVLLELPLNNTTLVPNTLNSIEVTFRDGAGNETVRTFTIEHTAVGAPLVWVRDTQYSSSGDSRSFFTHWAKGTYKNEFGAIRRVVRWLVYNPNLEEVNLITTPTQSVSWNESWSEGLFPLGYGAFGVFDSSSTVMDPISGSNFQVQRFFFSNNYSAQCEPGAANSQSIYTPQMCFTESGYNAQNGYGYCGSAAGWFRYPRIGGVPAEATHYFGQSTGWWCEARDGAPRTVSFSPSRAVVPQTFVFAYANPTPTASESTVAPVYPSSCSTCENQWTVGPATTSTSNAISVYSTVFSPSRLTSTFPVQDLPLGTGPTGSNAVDVGFTYKLYATNGKFYCGTQTGTTYHVACDNPVIQQFWAADWRAHRITWSLNTVSFSLSGTIVPKTRPTLQLGTSGTGKLVGSSTDSVWSNILVSQSNSF